MPPFVRSLVISAGPDRIFSILADLHQSRQWMPAIQKIDEVTPGPFRLGTTWMETRKAGKRMMTSKIRVTGFDPPAKLSLEVESKVMKGQMAFDLKPVENATEVHYQAQMKGKGLLRLMTGSMNRMMAEEDKDILDRLRAQVEGKR